MRLQVGQVLQQQLNGKDLIVNVRPSTHGRTRVTLRQGITGIVGPNVLKRALEQTEIVCDVKIEVMYQAKQCTYC